MPANRKKRFYTSRLPKNEEIGDIFVISSSDFQLFGRSNLAGRYL